MEANVATSTRIRGTGLRNRCRSYVLQFNKRTFPTAASTDEMYRHCEHQGGAHLFEATATTGVGVFDTLKAVARGPDGRGIEKEVDGQAFVVRRPRRTGPEGHLSALPLLLLLRPARRACRRGSPGDRDQDPQRRRVELGPRSRATRRTSRRNWGRGAPALSRRHLSGRSAPSYWRIARRRLRETGSPGRPCAPGPRPSLGAGGRLGDPAPQLAPAGGHDPVEVAAPPRGAEHPQQDEPRPAQPRQRRVDLGELGPPQGSDVALDRAREVVSGARLLVEKAEEDVRQRHAETIWIQI